MFSMCIDVGSSPPYLWRSESFEVVMGLDLGGSQNLGDICDSVSKYASSKVSNLITSMTNKDALLEFHRIALPTKTKLATMTQQKDMTFSTRPGTTSICRRILSSSSALCHRCLWQCTALPTTSLPFVFLVQLFEAVVCLRDGCGAVKVRLEAEAAPDKDQQKASHKLIEKRMARLKISIARFPDDFGASKFSKRIQDLMGEFEDMVIARRKDILGEAAADLEAMQKEIDGVMSSTDFRSMLLELSLADPTLEPMRGVLPHLEPDCVGRNYCQLYAGISKQIADVEAQYNDCNVPFDRNAFLTEDMVAAIASISVAQASTKEDYHTALKRTTMLLDLSGLPTTLKAVLQKFTDPFPS